MLDCDIVHARIHRLRRQRLRRNSQLREHLGAFADEVIVVQPLNAGAREHLAQAGNALEVSRFGDRVPVVRPGIGPLGLERAIFRDRQLAHTDAVREHEFFDGGIKRTQSGTTHAPDAGQWSMPLREDRRVTSIRPGAASLDGNWVESLLREIFELALVLVARDAMTRVPLPYRIVYERSQVDVLV